MLSYLYVYLENDKIEDAIKYGMKLSEHANKIITLSKELKGINAYLSPKDSELYYNEAFTCLKVSDENLNVYVYNKVCENLNSIEHFFCKLDKYKIGSYEEPIALICSTILPENISLYNNIIDTPLIIENSREFFYEKSVYDMLDSGRFSYFELYQMLLILGEQKNIFQVIYNDNQTKVYQNRFNLKKYTRKNKF